MVENELLGIVFIFKSIRDDYKCLHLNLLVFALK